MANNYDNIELVWTNSGNYSFSDAGDLKDTSSDALLSVVQEIQTVCKSSLQDWKIWPGIGADADESVGEPNIEETSVELHDRLMVGIIAMGIVDEDDLDITIIPVHRTEVLIVIRVNAVPTPYNALGEDQLLIVKFIFNYFEKGVFFLQEPPILTEQT